MEIQDGSPVVTDPRIASLISKLLQEAETAKNAEDWVVVLDRSRDVLTLDPTNEAATRFLDTSITELQKQKGPQSPSHRPRQFVQYIRDNPIVILIPLAASLVAATGILLGLFDDILSLYQQEVQWKQQQYKTIRSLHAGTNLSAFKSALGEPVHQRESRDERFIQHIFKGREFWVQTISNKNTETVLAFGLTACDDLKPVRDSRIAQAKLRESTLASLSPVVGSSRQSPSQLYYFDGARRAYFFDVYYGGPHTGYMTYYFGLNPLVCDQYDDLMSSVALEALKKGHDWFGLPQPYDESDEELSKFRRGVVINTFVETAAEVTPSEFFLEFPIGPDSDVTRGVPVPGNSK
jgi:hypothetical protein